MRYFTGFTLCLAALLVFATPLRADITTNPSRMVLGENDRAGEVKIHNSGGHTLRIETGWTAIAQGPDGVLHPIPQGAAPNDTKGLHLWPQVFTLKPGDTRAVYVVLDPKSQVEDERHVHIRIDADRVNGKGPRWGLTLPVFVREAAMPVSAQITEARWAGAQSLMVSLYREDGATPYGRLIASNDRGEILGELGNITLYADRQTIQYKIPLERLPEGAVIISYLGSGEFENQVFDTLQMH
ncbi:MAG: hypothetical protein COA84_15350 [Robiginitomaculum sp.]|nr:MAG: hypothetical protein COA84_15350 [Robiginitomaculum sp.]